MEYQCGKCKHYMVQSEFAGICTNPGCSFFCTHVGITSTCSKWEAENTVHEYRPPTKAESLCSRCFHRNACSSVLKEHLLIKELVCGKIPVCKDFVEIIQCKECKYAYINSFSDSQGKALCRYWTNQAAGKQAVTKQDDFCSYGERRSEDEK